jgi:hypothetical protein
MNIKALFLFCTVSVGVFIKIKVPEQPGMQLQVERNKHELYETMAIILMTAVQLRCRIKQ